ncbi:MAG: hypothetical protein AB1626_03315, partial [Candidatus Micrarchaeota archaeon]
MFSHAAGAQNDAKPKGFAFRHRAKLDAEPSSEDSGVAHPRRLLLPEVPSEAAGFSPRSVSLEQRVHSLARQAKHAIFSVEEAKSWRLCSDRVLRVVLARMLRKGLVKRLARGLYFAPPLEQRNAAPDDLLYAAQLAYGGYLAFATALYLHRLTDEFPFTIFVATRGKSGSKRFGEVEVRAVA